MVYWTATAMTSTSRQVQVLFSASIIRTVSVPCRNVAPIRVEASRFHTRMSETVHTATKLAMPLRHHTNRHFVSEKARIWQMEHLWVAMARSMEKVAEHATNKTAAHF
jgi:uncharacterized protein YhbP (UPF0306 family)